MNTAIPTNWIRAAAWIFSSLGALVVSTAAAITVGPKDNIYIGGFFSQGYLYSEHNNYPTANKGGTADFREAAINVSTNLGANFRIGAQAFAQSFGNIGEDRVILDWAVADYNFRPEFGIRAGRVKYPKGLYGEALDLDSVRAGVFLPLQFYNPMLRDFQASFDGAMVYGSIMAGDSSFDYKVFYGDIPMSPRQGVGEFFNGVTVFDPRTGVEELGMESVLGAHFVWNTPVSGLKFAYSFSQFEDLYGSGAFVQYPVIQAKIGSGTWDYHTVSAEYFVGDWLLAAEWQRSQSTNFYIDLAPIAPLQEAKVGWDFYYVSAARRLNEQWELASYIGYSTEVFGDEDQWDLAVSARFDYSQNLLFKAEVHWLEGSLQTFNTPRTPNPVIEDSDVLLALKTTFTF